MKRAMVNWIFACGLLAGLTWSVTSLSAPKEPTSGTVPVSMIVSAEAKHGQPISTVGREDVRAFMNKERVAVTEWTSLQGEHAGLDLLFLVDDGIDSDVGMQFDPLRQFMAEQPATTSIAVGYIHYGMVEILQNFTADHALAAKALRIPMGGSSETTSPYLAMSDYIDHWRANGDRREIILISDGVDMLEVGPNPMSVAKAVGHAQAGNIQIYTIYAPGTGHSGHSWWRINWGQSNLGQIADETGGESYGLMPGPPISYQPFLSEINERLNHQYLLTFLAKAEFAGTFQSVHLETEVPDTELVGASHVYVPRSK